MTNSTTTQTPQITINEEVQNILHKIQVDNPDFDDLRPTFMALAILMSITIVLGNVIVLLLFYQERKSLKVAHRYIVSMAICDLLMGLLSVPTQIFMLDQKITASSHHCPWIMGTITALVQTSLAVLVASSIDRYWAVKYPHHYRQKATPFVANCIITISWMIPCSFGFIHFMTAREAKIEKALCFMGSETYNPILLGFLIYGVMPAQLIAIVALYVLIHLEMSKLFKGQRFYSQFMNLAFRRQDNNGPKKVGSMNMREIRTTLLLLITVALAFITFLPGTGIGYLMNFDPKLLEVKSLLICYLLLSINSVFNPFIYAFNIRNVRYAAYRLMKRILCCGIDEDTTDVSVSGTGVDSSQQKSERT
uniref:CSON003215 protein n=1 Tax=Culicoides sonorensis TaxID=179676 RepID=A0A336LC26_CULSO